MFVCNIQVDTEAKLAALGQDCTFEIDIHDYIIITVMYRQYEVKEEVGKFSISVLELLSEGADMSQVQVELPLENDSRFVVSFRAEVMSTMRKPFVDMLYNSVDKDHDNLITRYETKLFCQSAKFQEWEKLFNILDRSSQGEISKGEFYHCNALSLSH